MVRLQHSDLSKWWPTRDSISSCSALISNNVYLRSRFTVIPDVPRETLLSQYQSFILTGKPGLLMPYPTYMKRVSLNCASFTFSNPYPGQLPDDTGNFYDRMGNVPRGTFEASERCGSIEYCGSVPIPLPGFCVIAISGVLRLERNETLLCASYWLRQTSCVNRISPVPVLSIEIGFAAALFHTFATSSSAALPGNCFTWNTLQLRVCFHNNRTQSRICPANYL